MKKVNILVVDDEARMRKLIKDFLSKKEFDVIEAEDGEKAAYVPAKNWQSDGFVFTTALTNLAVSNYNRNYTAVPYIRCTDADGEEVEFTNAAVTRSIYQVAAGLLMNGYDIEGDNNGVETDGKYEIEKIDDEVSVVKIKTEPGTHTVKIKFKGEGFSYLANMTE